MRRAPESAPAPAPRTLAGLTVIRDERTFRFLTPVFGGGVVVHGKEPWKKDPDPRTPVRVPSIRGQLRFWWRACNRHGYTAEKALWEHEARVFGSTTVPSPLVLSITGKPEPAREVAVLKDRFAVVDERHGRAYGAFPLRDTGSGTDHGVLYEHPGEWTLSISYPAELEEDVEAAFWAWAHFGGLGGRVRRGFGAVEEVRRARGGLATIDAGWQRFVSGVSAPWPRLPAFGARRLRAKSGGWKSGADAQEYLLGILRRLRQVDIGRRREADDAPGRHPGRSYWPEPDAIRKLTGVSSREHSKPVTNVDAFPRAVFGMPIIFHFKARTDPDGPMLVPSVKGKTKGRLASPLILRPHRAENGSMEALALALAHPDPDSVVLVEKNGHKPPTRVRVTLNENEALNLGRGGRPSPLVTMTGAVIADPIDRFLEEIR